MPADSSHYLFKHHPESCDPDDIWGQVKRTVKGRPVDAAQIALIVGAIAHGLTLQSSDRLLDLCCGNGALTTALFAQCSGGLGVDYSPFLIDVAQRRFMRRPSESYVMDDALAYLASEANPTSFHKVMCYGAFPYFEPAMAVRMLVLLHERYTQVTRIHLGQLPDKDRIGSFFIARPAAPDEADDPGSLMGIWRTPQEMVMLAQTAGWQAEVRHMPADFYAAHYRYDAVLTRL